MPSDSTPLTILIVDSLAERGEELLDIFRARGEHGLLAFTLPEAQQLIADHPIAAVMFAWPQDGLDLTAAAELVKPTAKPLLLLTDDSSTPTPGEPFQRCDRRDLGTYLKLLRRLDQAEQALSAARQQLYSSARSTLLGDIIAGVAHDLNNPLTAILGNAELLPKQPDDDDQQGVEQIIASARRAQSLVQSMLVIARSRPGQGQWFDSRLLISDTVNLLMAMLRSYGVRLQLDLAPDLPHAWGELGQIQQALLHVLLNALQAVQQQPERQLLVRGKRSFSAAGECLAIELSDNGPGVPEVLAPKISEPFFTTRPRGQGAGLGLTIAQQIIRRAGGSIELFTPAAGGAGFRIILPLYAPQAFLDDAEQAEVR